MGGGARLLRDTICVHSLLAEAQAVAEQMPTILELDATGSMDSRAQGFSG